MVESGAGGGIEIIQEEGGGSLEEVSGDRRIEEKRKEWGESAREWERGGRGLGGR